jgi:hypothetical protein
MKRDTYWTVENFSFVEKYLLMMPEEYQQQYKKDREAGYALQRKWQKPHKSESGQHVLNSDGINGRPAVVRKFASLLAPHEYLFLPSAKAVNGELTDEVIKIKKGDPVVLVFQMGKVGSSSIYKSISEVWPKIPAYHVHHLNNEDIHGGIFWHCASGIQKRFIPEHLLVSLGLTGFMSRHRADVSWKIISLVRDPIALQVSTVFQNITGGYSEAFDFQENRIDRERFIALSKRLLLEHGTRKTHFLNWFDHNIKNFIGVDIYQYPFDKNTGYSIVNHNNFSILLIKMEKLHECFEKAMSDFLGITGLRLPMVNVGSDKEFGKDYKEIKSSLKFESALCDEIYSTKLVKHFYSDSEIDDFKKKWSR